MLVLVFFANHNGYLTAVTQGNIPYQHTVVFYIIAIAMCAEIIIHAVQQFRIVWLVPIVHLLTYIQILIPWKRCGIVAVIGYKSDFFIYDSFFRVCYAYLQFYSLLQNLRLFFLTQPAKHQRI